MSGLFLGIGHGFLPSGRYDPGAVNPLDHAVEHDLARRVVYHATLNLRAHKVYVTSESDLPILTDPDYIGSVSAANRSGALGAVEVHFDWYRGTEGESGLYYSDAGRKLADYVHAGFKDHGQKTAENVHRPGLYFPRYCVMPAIIVECGRVEHRSESELASMGYALFLGLSRWLRNR